MDPIANMFSQISNAGAVGWERILISPSKVKMAILKLLKEHRQIADFRLVDKKITVKNKNKTKDVKQIEIELAKMPRLAINRISRPGRRVYTSSVKIPRPRRRAALVIISTSLGILDGEEARKKGLGGELIGEIN